MREFLFHMPDDNGLPLQTRIRQMIVTAILDGQLAPGATLPSCRKLAKTVGVARNTVVLAYEGLVDEGFLNARERSGFFVSTDVVDGRLKALRGEMPARTEISQEEQIDWSRRLRSPARDAVIVRKPADWQNFPFPFISGQLDPGLFPLAEWRECSRQAMGRVAVRDWANDARIEDDPDLIEQVRTRILPRRGVRASENEVLITVGAQHALWLIASLLATPRSLVGVENPGYVDARNVFGAVTRQLKPLAIDESGLIIDEQLDDCDLVFTTPSHQSPTTVTLPLERRRALLAKAHEKDFIIIEDDYEAETNFVGDPTPALKSLDTEGRVLYVGSLSKTLAPGLRIGYLVAPAEVIAEARRLRWLMMRHAPTNNQRTAALFLMLGHHDSLIRRLHKIYSQRWSAMRDALEKHLPDSHRAPTFGGSSFWVEGPSKLDSDRLAAQALDHGIVFEPGSVHFMGENPPRNFLRIGYSSISIERIEPGIERLASLIRSAS